VRQRRHGGVELAEANGGKLADEASEIAEMMGGAACDTPASRAPRGRVRPCKPSRSSTFSAARPGLCTARRDGRASFRWPARSKTGILEVTALRLCAAGRRFADSRCFFHRRLAVIFTR